MPGEDAVLATPGAQPRCQHHKGLLFPACWLLPASPCLMLFFARYRCAIQEEEYVSDKQEKLKAAA